MKPFLPVGLALLAGSALASKINTNAALIKADDENPCPDGLVNRYPSTLPKSFDIVGKAKLDAIWDTTLLREALENEDSWVIGQPWVLKATFDNKGDVARKFQFQGGFLPLEVPADCTNGCVLYIEGEVKASWRHAEFQYITDKPWTGGPIRMSNICLAPKQCMGFTCPHPLVQKLVSNTTIGHSEGRCCEARKCKDEVSCTPATQWENRADFETRDGSTVAGCCAAKYCPDDVCDSFPNWQKKHGTLRGTTKEECCEQKECADYTCQGKGSKAKPYLVFNGTHNVSRKGASDIECCGEDTCENFKIPEELKTMWKLKDVLDSIPGFNLSACAEPLLCGMSFICPNNSQMEPLPEQPSRQGSTMQECCVTKFCSDYTCSNETMHQKKYTPDTRPGSTDEECCELRFCRDFTCPSKTKSLQLSDQEAKSDLDRRGSSEEECCEPIYCRPEICEPASMWKSSPGKNLGSTMEECCEPVYCADIICDTDDDGDGVGTAWYKKQDTNQYKFQGSTVEECCLPKYCSQFKTSEPTKFKRKPQKDLQGSTEAECYDEVFCNKYCCLGDNLVLRPGAETRLGSTDKECCMEP